MKPPFGCQDVDMVGLGVAYPSMDEPDAETLSLFELDQYTNYSPESAFSMTSAPYSSEPTSYVYTGFWTSQGNEQESPLISERSLSGHSSSSQGSSSCFEIDPLTDDPPPTGPAYYAGPENPPLRPNLSLPYDVIPDLRVPLPPSSQISPQAPKERFVCEEGCEDRSFGRSYDLLRHVEEQHRCPHKDCSNVRFSTTQEKSNHKRQHGVTGPGWRCGTCVEFDGQYPKLLTRAEKLKKHFRKQHGRPISADSLEFRCDMEPCYIDESCGGLFFVSREQLEQHVERVHTSEHCPTERSGQTRIDSGHSSPFPECNPGAPSMKRRMDRSPGLDCKRWKVESDRFERSRSVQSGPAAAIARPSVGGHRLSPDPSARYLSSMTEAQNTSSGSPSAIAAPSSTKTPVALTETFSLSIIELQALTKQHDLGTIIVDLRTLEIKSTVDVRETSVRLHGTCLPSAMERGKKMLSGLIDKSRLTTFRKKEPDTGVDPQVKPSAQQVSVYPQPAMVALHPQDDAAVLKIWNQHLLPRFPTIAKDASIKGSYSVALVGQESEHGKMDVIKFRSARNQYKTSREMIREEVAKICQQNHHPPLEVHFSEGTLVRLVGEPSRRSFKVMDDPAINQKFPHQKRHWKRPGMGASIGLDHCPNISATFGGYILLDGALYMLSVDHFNSECQCEPKQSTVRSPSISHVEDVKEQLKNKLDEIHLKISRFGHVEVPLEQAGRLLFPKEISEELEQYKRFERELEDDENDFALGSVRYRCGHGEHPLQRPVTVTTQGELRRMDWSLTEITDRNREGQNRHRHRRLDEPTLGDLGGEINNPFGSGTLCQEIGNAIGGESVHYVGTTSGYREGTVSASLHLHTDDEGNSSLEWSIIVPEGQRLLADAFKGDSGAWIIGNDSKLLGLLWGWDGGLLLFTPIQDVFADIKRTIRTCREIQLPEFREPGQGQRSSTLLCGTSDGHAVPKSSERHRACIEPAVATPCILLPPEDDKSSLERNSSTSSLFSLPSLASSSSSTSLYEESTLRSPQAEQRRLRDATSGKYLAPPKVIQPRDFDDYGWHLIRQEEAMSEDEHTPWESDLQIRCRPRASLR